MKSLKLEFDKLNNTRDLGGMITQSGKKIIKNKLFRSGNLVRASEADIEQLRRKIELIVDFRTAKEVSEKSDPIIDGVKHIHLPAMNELTAGITREESATVSVIKRFAEDTNGAKDYMINIYKYFVTAQVPLVNYRKFIYLLLEKREKAVLWHCTAGKDRAGFASIIVQELLGIDEESIFEDYLYTNDCLKEEIKLITLELMHKYNIDGSNIEKSLRFQKAIDFLFGAKEEYFLGLFEKIKEVYGNFDGFISKGLKITDEQRETFCNLYLV